MTKKGALQRKPSSVPTSIPPGKPSSIPSSSHEHEAHEIEILSLEEKLKMYEKYRLSGDFEKDFVYLSTLLGYNIAVHRRNKPITVRHSPLLENNMCRLSDKKAIMEYHSESGISTPRSLFINDRRKDDYLRRHVEIATEWESHKEIVKELYIRGWLLDVKIIDVLQKTSVELERLTVVNMWNVGLNDTTLKLLAMCLAPCVSLRSLSLDGNTSLEKQQFDVFLDDTDKLKIQKLSLRSCMLDSRAATNISKSLLTNTSLLILNLRFNKLNDKDVEKLADSLRRNRTLLSLNLGSNCVTDKGVESISTAISTFPLTDEEVVEHRKFLVASRLDDKISPETDAGVDGSVTEETNPPTKQRTRSSNSKSSSKRPDSSSSSSNQKPSKDGGSPNRKSSKESTNKNSYSPSKTKELSGNTKQQKNQPSESTQVAGKTQKLVKQKSSSRLERNNKSASGTAQQQAPEQFKHVDPLQEKTYEVEGHLWIPGNRSLINLNLSRNKITCTGVESLNSAIRYQVDYAQENNSTVGVGLLRLCLEKNGFHAEEPVYCALMALMKIRDPFYKPIEIEEVKKDE